MKITTIKKLTSVTLAVLLVITLVLQTRTYALQSTTNTEQTITYQKKWEYQIPTNYTPRDSVSSTNGNSYTTYYDEDNAIYRLIALDKNGSFRWEIDTDDRHQLNATTDNDIVYISKFIKDGTSGSNREFSLSAVTEDGNTLWSYQNKDAFHVQLSDDKIFLNHNDYYLIMNKNGKVIEKKNLVGGIFAGFDGTEILYKTVSEKDKRYTNIRAVSSNGEKLLEFNSDLGYSLTLATVTKQKNIILALKTTTITPSQVCSYTNEGTQKWCYLLNWTDTIDGKIVIGPNEEVYTTALRGSVIYAIDNNGNLMWKKPAQKNNHFNEHLSVDKDNLVHFGKEVYTLNGVKVAEVEDTSTNLFATDDGSYYVLEYNDQNKRLMKYDYDFKDVTGHWAEKGIQNLIQQQIINGYADGTFKPDNTISKEEFLTILVKVKKLSVSANPSAFKDVSAQRWSYPYIQAAVDHGILDPAESNALLNPSEPISREDMAIMIARGYELKDGDNVLRFSDTNQLTKEPKKIAAIVKAGIMNGFEDNTFKPKGNTTRAQAATVIARLLK